MIKQRGQPTSWVSIEGVEISADEFPDGSFRFTCDFSKRDCVDAFDIVLHSTLPEALHAVHQVAISILDNFPFAFVTLVIETLPDQRADRTEKPGMSIPLVTTAAFLSVMPIDKIKVHDVHSKLGLEALKTACAQGKIEVVHEEPIDCFVETLYRVWPDEYTPRFDHVVAVDKGAIERAQQVKDHFGSTIIYADKKRVNGQVIGHDLVGQLERPIKPTDTIWIVDDLCDGGATFISIAKLLRRNLVFGDLNLYVTHGLFSKGKEELSQHYTNILARFDRTGA